MHQLRQLILFAFVLNLCLFAQPLSPKLWQSLNWRSIGPFRGGRTVGATGVRSQPNVFYIGVNNGGVWKTNDYGRTWKPLFDKQPTGSIGDIAVAQSNPNIIYAASGEGLQRPDLSVGDGVYKSIDGGTTWRNMGLRDAQQIASVIVDPRDPNRVFVAALGHPYGPNTERGIYRSLDGGQTWQRVLYKDENTGAMQVEFDPQDSKTLYASLWAGRQGPWKMEPGTAQEAGFSNPQMVEQRGRNLLKDYPQLPRAWDASALAFHSATRKSFMQPWTPMLNLPASTGPTTQVLAGGE